MMTKKKILIGSIFAALFMISMPFVSALNTAPATATPTEENTAPDAATPTEENTMGTYYTFTVHVYYDLNKNNVQDPSENSASARISVIPKFFPFIALKKNTVLPSGDATFKLSKTFIEKHPAWFIVANRIGGWIGGTGLITLLDHSYYAVALVKY